MITENYGSNYRDDWEKLFDKIKEAKISKSRMDKTNKLSYWVIFCKSIISASNFLSRFHSLEEFNNFISQYYLNENTRVALPILLDKEVYGLGFALACDFLKENGYPDFVKPDVHIKTIFYDIGISNSKDDYAVFKDVIRFAQTIGKKPYEVDKLFWLVGSGEYYLNPEIHIKPKRKDFIKMVKSTLAKTSL